MVQQGDIEVGPQFKYATIAAGAGDNTIVAAVTGKKIRVVAYNLTVTGTAGSLRWESGAGGTALSGLMTPLAGVSINASYCPGGLFETASDALLNLELATYTAAVGHLTYVEVD